MGFTCPHFQRWWRPTTQHATSAWMSGPTMGECPWFCDCSCCGGLAGFAHLTCIAKATKHKCRLATAEDVRAFVELWQNCPDCKQGYMNQLSINLSDAFIAFAETSYWHPRNSMWGKMKVLAPIGSKKMTLHNIILANLRMGVTGSCKKKMECKMLINKLLLCVCVSGLRFRSGVL